MKKIFVLSTILFACISCTRNTYKISGNIENLEDWVYFELETGQIDSAFVDNGTFVFEGYLKEPVFAKIYNRDRLYIFLIPDNREISIKGSTATVDKIEVTGSPLTEKANEVVKFLSSEFEKFYAIPEKEQREKLFEDWKKEISKVISENSDNVVGVLAFINNTFYFSPDEILEYITLLSPEMQKNPNIQKERARAEQKKLTSEGNRYIDIRLHDTEEIEKSLSDFAEKGNYVLLDFWASWCGPCFVQVPKLKEIYEEYHSKGFEIFGVSIDTNKESWLKSIEKHNMNWIHVSSLKGWDCPAGKLYGIMTIPATYLIDSKGIIIKKDIQASDLEEILNSVYN